jgi:aryl-alcohol dehydrogenase
MQVTSVIAAVARTPGQDFMIEPLVLAHPQSDEVLVRIAGVGICHTDLVARDQIIPVPLPAVFGHEGAGIVEAVGSEVRDLVPGDKVVLSYLSCGRCPQCGHSDFGYCAHFGALNFLGRRTDGTSAIRDEAGPISGHFFAQSSFATYAIAHERNTVKVDSALPLEMLGALGCGIQTGAGAIFHSLDCQPGSSVAIFGGGSVGMSAVMAAAVRKCAPIIVVEPVEARRNLALELGATHVIDPGVDDAPGAIREIRPDGVDFVVEVTGIPAVIEAAIASLVKRGTCALMGSPQKAGETFSVRTGTFITSGARLIGVMQGDSDPQTFIPELLALQAAGKFPFEKLMTTYQFADINRAIADQAKGIVLKPVLVM